MKLRLIALAALAIASAQAQADTVALWDFNSFTCTSSCTAPKATQSANGAWLSSVGGVTFVGGVTGSGTGNAMNTTNYAAQGTETAMRGVQFMIDTSGYTDLVLTFAQRNSNTASAWTTLQYTTDGSIWQTATTFQMKTAGSFVNGLTYDFSNISEANGNASFGIRLLAIYAPGTSGYVGTATGSSYTSGPNGSAIRYDNVLLSGTPMPDLPEVPVDPVPEPQTVAMMLAGLAALGLIARRRRAD